MPPPWLSSPPGANSYPYAPLCLFLIGFMLYRMLLWKARHVPPLHHRGIVTRTDNIASSYGLDRMLHWMAA